MLCCSVAGAAIFVEEVELQHSILFIFSDCCYHRLMTPLGLRKTNFLHVQRSFKSVYSSTLDLGPVGKVKRRCPLLFAQIAARCSQRHEAPKAWILTLAFNKL